MKFKKLSRKIGFTETELKVVAFLLITFAFGLSYKILFHNPPSAEYKVFDYSEQDSLFESSRERIEKLKEENSANNLVDIKREVFEFKEQTSYNNTKKILPNEKSINLNTATKEELITLPGIGEKTAEKILELRNIKGNYSSLDELLEVKGIGDTKFNNIKKFLYIK